MHEREVQMSERQGWKQRPHSPPACPTYDTTMLVRVVWVCRRLASFSMPRTPIMVLRRLKEVRVEFTDRAAMTASMPKGPIWQSRMSRDCGDTWGRGGGGKERRAHREVSKG
jgi:hypothetical protein